MYANCIKINSFIHIESNNFDTLSIKVFSFLGMKMFIFLFLVWRNQKNVILENNLDVNQVVAKNATTGNDGKTYIVSFYNLDVIIPLYVCL